MPYGSNGFDRSSKIEVTIAMNDKGTPQRNSLILFMITEFLECVANFFTSLSFQKFSYPSYVMSVKQIQNTFQHFFRYHILS